MNEQDYIQGGQAAWRHMLTICIKHLDPETEGEQKDIRIAQLVSERTATIAALREVCETFGDNDWEDNLHLQDIIGRHLTRHLWSEQSEKSELPCDFDGIIKKHQEVIEKDYCAPDSDEMPENHVIMIVSKLLEMAGDEFSNHGCNDLPDDFFEEMTKKEIQKLYQTFHKWNGDPEDYDSRIGYLGDSALMSFFSEYIKRLTRH